MGAAQREVLSRERIIATAQQLLAAEGLDAVSLRRLASELGVTAPALYAHVESKAVLLAALGDAEFALLAERLRAVAAASSDPVEQIRAQSCAYVEHALARPALFQLMAVFRPAWVDQPAATELEGASAAFEVATEPVSAAIAAGRITERDVLLTSLTIWAAAHGVATVPLSQPGLGPELEGALIDSVVDAVVTGLCAAPG